MSPGFAIPECSVSSEDLATAALVALPLAYFAALGVLALLTWLWRRKAATVAPEWRSLVGCGAVVLLIGLILWPGVDRDLLAGAVMIEAPFLAATIGLLARLAVSLCSAGLLRWGPILAATAFAVVNLAVFAVGPGAAQRIIDAELAFLGFDGNWLWYAIVLALVLEAVFIFERPDADASLTDVDG